MARCLEGRPVSNEHELGAADLPFEFMLGALRLREGFESRLFTERTGLAEAALEPGLRAARQRGLLEGDGPVLRPTARGFDFLSDLQQLFLPR